MKRNRPALLSMLLLGATGTALMARPAAAPRWNADEARTIAAWKPRPAPHRDARIEARIRQILSGMTLEQKIGQMTQPSILSVTPDEVRHYAIGSVLNGGGGWPGGNKHASVADWVKLAKAYEQASLSTDMKIKVPVIWGVDAVHGHNNIYGATTFPQNIGLGATNDPDLVERIGRATARQVRATGIGWAFAPTLAVVQNQRWGRSYEGYSSDPALVSRLGSALVRGLQGKLNGDGDVLASAKHFVGDGGTWRGIDQGENRSGEVTLASLHGAGYYAALDAGVQTVMVSYNSWARDGAQVQGKMHGNRALITGVLKDRLKFDGLVVSDWNAIEQVTGCERDHCPAAFNAGVDLFMVPDNWKSFIAKAVADVREGRVPMARIDDAVSRILRVKLRMGLLERPTSAGKLTGDTAQLDARALAQEAVRKSAVLFKNDNAVLPLAPGKRILVVGAGADSFPAQSGGWSMTWQGDETDNADYPLGETLLGGLKRVYGADRVAYSADGSLFAAGKYDAVIAVMGERPYAEMKGDVRWPAPLAHSVLYPDQAALLARVAGQGTPVVSVLYSGRATYSTDLINRSDAFVAAFLPGSEAGALADLIAGRQGLDFHGRLPVAWPNTACPSGSEPIGERLFARGFGLSYAHRVATGRLVEAPIVPACP